MAKAKYKEYYQKMLTDNQEKFEKFRKIHDLYEKDSEKMQEKYNEIGKQILEIVNEYENRLCSQSEKGGYGHYTPRLAEKFRDVIRKDFPLFDHIGIIVEKFEVKKISLPASR